MNSVMNHEECVELLPIYAIDALDPMESTLIRAHIAECAECAQELTALHESVVGGLATEIEPPAWIHDSLLERATEVAPLAVVDLNRAQTGTVVGQNRHSWGKRLLAAAAVVIAVSGWAVASTSGGKLPTSGSAIATIEDNPSHITIELASFATKKYLKIVTANGLADVTSTNLRTLPSGEAYQLWGISKGQFISLSVMGRDPKGGVFAYPQSAKYNALAVTIGPSQGTQSPIGNPVVEVSKPRTS